MDKISMLVYGIIVVSAILGVGAFMRKPREKVLGLNKNIFAVVFAGIVIALLLGQMGYISYLNFSGTAVGVTPWLAVGGTGNNGNTGNTQASNGVCPAGTMVASTTVTLSAVDKYTTGAVGGTDRYRVNGGAEATVSNGGTFTASPGDSVEVLWANGTSGYFSDLSTYTIPCKGTVTLGTDGTNPKTLAQNGTLSITFFNDPKNQPIDGTSANQTLSAGDTKNVKTLIQGQYQRDNPNGYDLVIEYNKTSIQNVVFMANGVELQKGSTPHSFSTTFGTDSASVTYFVPATISNTEYDYTTTVKASDSVNPQATSGNLKFTLYSKNYFIDNKDGGKVKGPASEDSTQTVTRQGTNTATLYID